MWLINTGNHQLEFVNEPEEYTYAILSHTWEDDEVSFQDFQIPGKVYKENGFGKIVRTCQLAASRGLRYAWIDTCCIDKSSSAELSEAINSMFKWYMKSAVCFVFLSDLPSESSFEDHFPHCRWLTRGWTLQEIVAPRVAEFYDAKWELRGRKPELNTFLASVTRIDYAVLCDSQAMFNVPVARRMSWASMRETTRVENKAYCLLGIFGVSMPMLYGEGPKAFMRLQEEIAKESSDLSLFAWTCPPPSIGSESLIQQSYRGIFARSPKEFAHAQHLKPRIKDAIIDTEFAITNKGLRIETALIRVLDATDDLVWDLGVSERDDWPKDRADGWIGVYLAKTANGYVRSKPHSLFRAEPQMGRYRGASSLVYIRKDLRTSESEIVHNRFRGAIYANFSKAPCKILAAAPQQLWDYNRNIFLSQGQGINAYLLLQYGNTENYTSGTHFIVAFSTMDEPICYIFSSQHPMFKRAYQFMKTAKEITHYVSADYLRVKFLSGRAPAQSSPALCSIRQPQSNSVIIFQAELKPHIFQNQACFSLELVLEQVAVDNPVNTQGISSMNLC
ncbi:HET-domain-containing protein [Daldinia decipiens]|uniref:HET-domain-containing protein n=1 Tax=Daldinia decipiens TaxID=326647 RepID=UPI0020C41A37|nr:HET-domain-containing protein [Daldinia decipiens]KAI1654407.1 HET-domain-containing protein [Daldinia decipiens]